MQAAIGAGLRARARGAADLSSWTPPRATAQRGDRESAALDRLSSDERAK
jgi:hypothetical protein